MPTFKRAPEPVEKLGAEILNKYDTHKLVKDLGVKVDLIMAYADLDGEGFPTGDALKHNGVKALGICRIIPVKQRVMGRGDAEISLDGNHWDDASAEEKAALLDHELHHICIALDKQGAPKYDDIGRPKLKMRKHDYQFGWFSIVAVRHGLNSQECKQAQQIMDGAGQFYWPQIGSAQKKQLTSGKKR